MNNKNLYSNSALLDVKNSNQTLGGYLKLNSCRVLVGKKQILEPLQQRHIILLIIGLSIFCIGSAYVII